MVCVCVCVCVGGQQGYLDLVRDRCANLNSTELSTYINLRTHTSLTLAASSDALRLSYVFTQTETKSSLCFQNSVSEI